MEAKTANDLKVLELLFNGNEHFEYSISEHFINIKCLNGNGEYTVLKENILSVDIHTDLVAQIRVGLTIKGNKYLYFNITKNYIMATL